MTITDSRPTSGGSIPITMASGGPQLAGGQAIPGAQIPRAAGTDSRPTVPTSQPIGHASGGDQFADRHSTTGTRGGTAVSSKPTDRRTGTDDHRVFAVGASPRSAEDDATSSAPTPSGPEPTDRHEVADTHHVRAVGVEAGRGPAAKIDPTPTTGSLLDPALSLAADVLDDIERVRIANANRLQILTRSVEDSDGEVRGFGLDESHPDVARLAAMVELLSKVEHDAELNLGRMMRRHPLHVWIKAQRGIGDKQGARLLAAIGDPYINSSTGQPRTVSALWAYCGLHVLPAGDQGPTGTHTASVAGRDQLPVGGDPGPMLLDAHGQHAGVAPKRAKGQRANWSTRAKTKAYLVATSCMKQLVAPCARDGDGPAAHVDACSCSPYRVVYDGRRRHTAVTRPDWSDGHSHNDALRVAAKAILRDLWRAARAFHCGPEDESR